MSDRFWALSLAYVVLPNVLCGQGLRGTIRDSASGLAVPAAVISAVGLPDSLTRRVLSDATGIYRIQLPDGVRRIRVVRIGFRPRTIDVPAASDQSVDIRLERLPTMLERVRINDQPNCSRRADRATALALWEQARAGLLATVVARDENQARLKRFNYYRIIGEERATILSQVVTTEEVRNGRPFGAARSASYFASHGFRDDSGSYPTFYAPDADVLLDESFTKAYCFHVAEADERHRGAIGLGFEPAHSRAGRVDIAGTVWIDSTARSLSDIQFQYRGLPRDEQLLRLGGRVSFRVMPAGFTIIDRWSMQLPAHTAPPSRSPTYPVERHKIEIHEVGGELASARWDNGDAWSAKLSELAGQVSLLGVPVPHAKVRLVGTSFSAETDSTGAFRIPRVLPGRYTLAVTDSELNSVGLELTRGPSFELQRDSVHHLAFELPTPDDFIANKCPRFFGNGFSIVVGRVMRPDGSLASLARLQLRQAMVAPMAGQPAHPLRKKPGEEVSTKDTAAALWLQIYEGTAGPNTMFLSAFDGSEGATGTFFICRAPAQQVLRLEVEADGLKGSQAFVTNVVGRRLYVIPLRLGR